MNQSAGLQNAPRAIPDGSGGSLVSFNSNGEVRVHHVLSSDAVDASWPAGGRLVAMATDVNTAITSDGGGGALVAWAQGAGHDIYVHHVLASGGLDPTWPSFGVPVCTAPNDQVSISIVSDGAAGALLAWTDLRTGQDIFAHHVLASGSVDPAWPANGLAIISDAFEQANPVATSDGSGGILIAWEDTRTGNRDIYAQRVLASGTIAAGWPAGGRSLVSNNSDQDRPRICTDGSAGAIVAWRDLRQGDYDVFAMRVGAAGSLGQGWKNGGEILCDASGDQHLTDLVADGSGGAVAAWIDNRTPPGSYDVYVQRVTSGGSVSWTANGVAICTATDNQYSASLGVDGTAGAFLVAWQDKRMATPQQPAPTDLYMHRVLATGSPDGTWPVNGMRLTFDGKVREDPNVRQPIVSHGSGSATVFWTGNASIDPLDDVFAMNVTSAAYTVTLAVVPAGGGTATKSPDQVAYVPGSQVTLSASTALGYQFVNWSGDASGSANPLILTVDGTKNVVANFELQPPGCGKWSKILSATEPPPRSGAPTVWDPVRHRVLLFGGYDGSNYLNDVWQFTLAQGWSQITTFATPPTPRSAAGLIYDPVRDRLVVVAGNSGTPPNDVWALSLTGNHTWSQITPTGTPPSARPGFTTIYDPLRDRILMFGGSFTNATWELSLSGTPAWTQLSLASPPAGRSWHVAIYDPVRDRMIIQGGQGPIGNTISDTWALALSPSPAWAQLTPHTPPSQSTPATTQAAAVYDPLRDRMVLIAGLGYVADTARVSTLSFELQPMWNMVLRAGWPYEARYLQSAVYEPDHDLVLVFNGIKEGTAGFPPADFGRRLDLSGGWWLQTGGDHAGGVTAYPTKNCYDDGESVTLLAVGQTGYGLDHWTGDASGTNPLIDVTMDSDKTILALFHTSPVGVEEPVLAFALGEIAPNPSAGPLKISYSLPQTAAVRLGVFDVSGRLVTRLVEGVQGPGRRTASWDGVATAGIYFVRFETPVGTWTRRVALLR